MTFILSTGSFLPEQLVPNSELTQFPPLSLPLIEKKTGISSRYRAADNILTSDLAFNAARICLDKAAFAADRLDALVLGTSTPDRLIPATATRVAARLGATNAFAYDINSVCSSSVFLLQQAYSLIQSGSARHVLVVAADCYSKILNPKDFSTFPYFGDGAGAVLLSADPRSDLELLCGIFHSDGSGYETITLRAGAGEYPAHSLPGVENCYFEMNGRAVYDFALDAGSSVILEMLDKYSMAKEDVFAVIAHQANVNVINGIAERTGIPRGKFFQNLARCGNTAGASVLLALDEYLTETPLVKGASLITCAFGGGLSWGGNLIRKNG